MPETRTTPTEPESNLNDAIEGVFGILMRRRWWIIAGASIVPLLVVAVAMKLPDRYVSQATLLVVQQQVSQRYVEPDSTTTVPAAVEAMKLEVLSRSRLLGIINELGLYPTAPGEERPAPELLVEQMRKDIDIQPLETTPGRNDFNAFTVAYTAPTPSVAQGVTSRLTSLFIEQNARTRGEQAANTTKFLSDHLDAARQKLEQQEQRLQAFKTSNLGELPEQQSENLAALTDVRGRLETVSSNLLLVQQQQATIESTLNDNLTHLEAEKASLLTRYTPMYPQVVKKQHEIERVQAVLERLKTGNAQPGKQQDAESSEDPVLQGVIRQAEASAAQAATLSKQQQKLKAESEGYQRRLNLTPLREQQLAEILRDYSLYKQDYTDLLNKKLQSQLTSNLEESQEGQQFRLVDPPALPVRPSAPKRLKIALGGLGGGILVGLALAFLIDMRDSSFHSEKALTNSFSVPLVLGVPLVRTQSERRSRGWRITFEWLAASAMTLTMLAAEFYVFRNG